MLDSSSADVSEERGGKGTRTMLVEKLSWCIPIDPDVGVQTHDLAAPIPSAIVLQTFPAQRSMCIPACFTSHFRAAPVGQECTVQYGTRHETYQRARLSSSPNPSRSSPPSSGPQINSFSPVSSHNLFANRWSSTWNRSLTLTASPFFGFPGVVTSGSVLKKLTYVLQSDAVKNVDVVYIWFSITGVNVRSSREMRGLRGGQSGAAGFGCSVADLPPRADFEGAGLNFPMVFWKEARCWELGCF